MSEAHPQVAAVLAQYPTLVLRQRVVHGPAALLCRVCEQELEVHDHSREVSELRFWSGSAVFTTNKPELVEQYMVVRCGCVLNPSTLSGPAEYHIPFERYT